MADTLKAAEKIVPANESRRGSKAETDGRRNSKSVKPATSGAGKRASTTDNKINRTRTMKETLKEGKAFLNKKKPSTKRSGSAKKGGAKAKPASKVAQKSARKEATKRTKTMQQTLDDAQAILGTGSDKKGKRASTSASKNQSGKRGRTLGKKDETKQETLEKRQVVQ